MVNSRKIEDLHPKLQELCKKHIEACKKRGIDIQVTNTLRDAEYQEYLFAQGRTRPGNIVTKMKQVGPHGFGLAYDVVPVVYGKTIWENPKYWQIVGEEGKKLGLTWGGEWKSFIDQPHFEYTGGLTAAQLRAGMRPSWWQQSKKFDYPKVIIKPGTVADEVKILQAQLNKFGYKLHIDGDYGMITQGAVKDFQRQRGLVADGIVGLKTWEKLFEG